MTFSKRAIFRFAVCMIASALTASVVMLLDNGVKLEEKFSFSANEDFSATFDMKQNTLILIETEEMYET